jgi:hypothetical protein
MCYKKCVLRVTKKKHGVHAKSYEYIDLYEKVSSKFM